MTTQQKLMLIALKGRTDGKMALAKCVVRAAYSGRGDPGNDYQRGFQDGYRWQAVQALRAVRDIQRHVDELYKGVGCHA